MENNKKKRVYNMEIDAADPESGVFALSLVESPAIESDFIYLSAVKELIELKTINEEKRLVLGAALIPDKEILRSDSDGDYYITFSKETVAKAAQLYLKRMNQWNTTLEHEKPVEGVSLVESWIVEDPKMDKSTALGLNVPAGTWMIGMSIDNTEIWNQYVKTNKVKGISLEGLFNHQRVNAAKENTGDNPGNEGSDTGSKEESTQEATKEEKLIEALKSILFEYLETSTSITSTNAGTFGSGSIITDAQ